MPVIMPDGTRLRTVWPYAAIEERRPTSTSPKPFEIDEISLVIDRGGGKRVPWRVQNRRLSAEKAIGRQPSSEIHRRCCGCSTRLKPHRAEKDNHGAHAGATNRDPAKELITSPHPCTEPPGGRTPGALSTAPPFPGELGRGGAPSATRRGAFLPGATQAARPGFLRASEPRHAGARRSRRACPRPCRAKAAFARWQEGGDPAPSERGGWKRSTCAIVACTKSGPWAAEAKKQAFSRGDLYYRLAVGGVGRFRR